MILRCNYEEVEALKGGARSFLGQAGKAGHGSVLAPPEARARVESLLPRLQGDLSFSTLAELRAVKVAVEAIVELLREALDAAVLTAHPADESAVNAYFAFAHGLSVASRVREMEAEMEAIIELVTGDSPSPEVVRGFRFPD